MISHAQPPLPEKLNRMQTPINAAKGASKHFSKVPPKQKAAKQTSNKVQPIYKIKYINPTSQVSNQVPGQKHPKKVKPNQDLRDEKEAIYGMVDVSEQ